MLHKEKGKLMDRLYDVTMDYHQDEWLICFHTAHAQWDRDIHLCSLVLGKQFYLLVFKRLLWSSASTQLRYAIKKGVHVPLKFPGSNQIAVTIKN